MLKKEKKLKKTMKNFLKINKKYKLKTSKNILHGGSSLIYQEPGLKTAKSIKKSMHNEYSIFKNGIFNNYYDEFDLYIGKIVESIGKNKIKEDNNFLITHINPIEKKIIESKDEDDLIIVSTMFEDLLSLLPTLNKITHSNSNKIKTLKLNPINNLKTNIERELRELTDFKHTKSQHIPHPPENTSEISKSSGRARASTVKRRLPADPPLSMRKQKIALLKKIKQFDVTELIDIFSKMFDDDNFGVLMMNNKDLFIDINNLIDSLKLLEETHIINKNNNIIIKNAKKESLKSLKDTIEKKYVEIINHIERLNSTNTVSSKSAARGRSKSPSATRGRSKSPSASRGRSPPASAKSSVSKKNSDNTEYVLVLCQRKTGLSSNKMHYVEDKEIPKIEEYVKNHFGDKKTKIEYLTDMKGYTTNTRSTADYILELTSDKFLDVNGIKIKNEFIKLKKNSYSLIILNTCPLIFMNYDIIYKLLKPNGIMVFKKYPNEMPFEIESISAENNMKLKKIEELERFFIKDGNIYTKKNNISSENEISPSPPKEISPSRKRSLSREKSPPAKSAARGSSITFTNSLNTIDAKKIYEILKTIDLEINETVPDGNCYFYSIYDSLNSLSSILNINFLEMFENCIINKVPEKIKYIEEKSTKNTKEDKIKKNFVKKIRFYLAKCIKEGILTDLAMFDSRNTEFEHQTLYNQVMSLDLNSDDHYRMLFEYDFKDILNYANTLKEFKENYPTEKHFNDKIATITIEMNTTEEITDNYVGSIIASILNFILKKCKNQNGYILEIKSFTSDIEGMRFTNSNKANILREINENLKKKIIIIPVFKLDFAHYNSILFFK